MIHTCSFKCNGKTRKQLQEEYDTNKSKLSMTITHLDNLDEIRDTLVNHCQEVFERFNENYPCWMIVADFDENDRSFDAVYERTVWEAIFKK